MKCVDCGTPLSDGEAKVFTCCDACWDKHYTEPPAATEPAGVSELGHSDEYYLAMAALDHYPIEDGLPKSTSVVYRIHQLGHALATLQAERDALKEELEGKSSCSSDPIVSLGLRKCLELQGETIAIHQALLVSARPYIERLRSEARDIAVMSSLRNNNAQVAARHMTDIADDLSALLERMPR